MSTTATAGAIEVLVELGDRSYPVVVGEGVRSQLGAILPSGTRRVAVVTEEGHPWLESTIEALDLPVSVHAIEGGEANKNLATIESLTSSFARAGISRADCIVGLGGATFPSHIKLRPGAKPTHTLVLNGAECEPFITCDDLLMRERAGEIIRGAGIMAQMLAVERVLIGVEDNKPDAIAAMRAAAGDGDRKSVV